MAGRFYEEFEIGQAIVHDLRQEITQADNLKFCELTHNLQPLHTDSEYAKATEFGRIVVNGLYTFSLMVGVSVADTTLGTLVANLGYDAVTMPAPVFPGDTLRFETTVLEKRESKSRPQAGVVTFEHRAFNQAGILVCQTRRTALMRKRGEA